MQDGKTLAAIDLGSNSFRLEIGRHEQGQIVRIEYLKETVRLGAGLDDDARLNPAAMRRGWDCLARFAERVRGLDARQVRAVATQTLREARNRVEFVDEAVRVLRFPIDVISGREEARLIYSGVSRFLPDASERRLVFDIGGRSTELVLGQGAQPKRVESYKVGSVELSMRYFADGRLSSRSFDAARVAAEAALEGSLGFLAGHDWDAVYGASGTVGAVSDILLAEGMSDGQITPGALAGLERRLIDAGHVDRVVLGGLKDDRRAVIGGGLSILQALCSLLGIERIEPARGALRHGVLYEMLSREAPKSDIRLVTVQRLQQKFGVDGVQARRVADMAQWLFAALHPTQDAEVLRASTKLRWAAELHEIGMAVSHDDFHRHGAYVLEHADVPGFAQHQLQRLATLVLAQRGGLRKVEPAMHDPVLRDQTLVLRIALVLCHARRDPTAGRLMLQRLADGYRLMLDSAWAAAHPQSMFLLREEAKAWARSPWPFELVIH
jgi:exopolyphosphatase / guanosine-5'-triphosphate,3'-diphosphate pyrophosphatase